MTTKSWLNLLCIGNDAETGGRCEFLAKEFEYSWKWIQKAQELSELGSLHDHIQVAIVDLDSLKSKEQIGMSIRSLRDMDGDCFICGVTSEPGELAEFARLAGAQFIFLRSDFFETSRLEFLASQIIRASYVPIKVDDFNRETALDFHLHHLMPLNKKFVVVVPKGQVLTEERFQKLSAVGDVFIRREEVDVYKGFLEKSPESPGVPLKTHCRAQYLSFCNSHTQLVMSLIDQAKESSFKEGKALYDRCAIVAKEFMPSLAAVGEPWEIVNHSTIGEFGSLERAPTLAAYAGLLSLKSSIGNPLDVMVAALMTDLGMLDLHPRITRKLRETLDVQSLDDSELNEYRKHPLRSLELCLQKKLALSESIKEMILCSHERVDGNGFPAQRNKAQIPMDSMLIQFSEMIDQAAMLRLGKAREPISEVRRNILKREITEGNIFSIEFLAKIKPVL